MLNVSRLAASKLNEVSCVNEVIRGDDSIEVRPKVPMCASVGLGYGSVWATEFYIMNFSREVENQHVY